jgi:SAM-dependent methyltransferase
MAESKDLFSSQAHLYAAFRPTYPEDLYAFVFQHLDKHEHAWDCATGNGQVATRLSDYFLRVSATDISLAQLSKATPRPNIDYRVGSAEDSGFASASFDLITVAQALHWFDVQKFNVEAARVLKTGGVLAVWGYGNLLISGKIGEMIEQFYFHVVGPYWDPGRKHVETAYEHLPFPFKRIPSPRFAINVRWTPAHLEGYLQSWSATQQFIKSKAHDPVPALMKEITSIAGDEPLEVSFPVFLKVGKKE